MASQPTILVVGTLDTKLNEVLYLRSQIISLSNNSCKVQVLDVSRTAKTAANYSTVPKSEFLTPLLDIAESLEDVAQGDYVDKAIAACAPIVKDLVTNAQIQGIIGVGGSTGSSLATALMRNACHVGFPKLMVSTMASGDVKPYIEETDITMMYSVVDIAGMNSILRNILTNAAGAIFGMTTAYASIEKGLEILEVSDHKKIAVTMFGVTTPAVDNIRKILTSAPHEIAGYEIYVFHATGSGGKAMERLISEGRIDAVVDLTTTEIADELFGGNLSAGPNRLDYITQKNIPTIVSVGACDMVNFGPRESIPSSITNDRNLYYHNPTVTLMRTSKEENTQIANFITSKLKAARDPKTVRVILPKGGVSMLDLANVEKPSTAPVAPSAQTQPPANNPVTGTTGQPWHDPEADTALFESIITDLQGSGVEVFEYPDNINDEAFAISVCEHLLEVMGIDPRKYRLANARRRRWSFDHGSTIDKLRRRNSVEIPDAA